MNFPDRHLTNCVTPLSIILLEKPLITQLVKKFYFMEPKISLSCSEESTTGPYPEPDASRPHLPTLFPQDPLFNIIFLSMTRVRETYSTNYLRGTLQLEQETNGVPLKWRDQNVWYSDSFKVVCVTVTATCNGIPSDLKIFTFKYGPTECRSL